MPEACLLKGGHATSSPCGFLPVQPRLRGRAELYANAPTPVISRPTISVCIVSVPS